MTPVPVSVFSRSPAKRAGSTDRPVNRPIRRVVSAKAASMTKLYYFGLSGRGEPARILLKLAGEDFEDYLMSGEVRAQTRSRHHELIGPSLLSSASNLTESIFHVRLMAQTVCRSGEPSSKPSHQLAAPRSSRSRMDL